MTPDEELRRRVIQTLVDQGVNPKELDSVRPGGVNDIADALLWLITADRRALLDRLEEKKLMYIDAAIGDAIHTVYAIPLSAIEAERSTSSGEEGK